MNRREFVTKATMGVAAGGLLAGCRKAGSDAAAVHTRPHVRWNLTSSYGPSLDVLHGACTAFSKRVAELTHDRFQIRVYAPGELVPALQVLDAVQQGTVQIGHTASYYYVGKNPALAFDTTIPFGLTARQQIAWLYEGGGLEIVRDLLSDFNIISFPAGSTGVQMGGWFRREIPSLQDLRGLKMRIPGMGGEVMSRMGVTVQVLSGGDVFPALERGVIDAVEWVGPHDDEKLGFHKVARFYYYPGWWEPGPTISFYVNRPAWDELPSDYQAAIRAASGEISQGMTASYDAKNPAALSRLLKEDVQLRAFPVESMKEARKITRDRLEEIAAQDAGFRKIYTAWDRFREDSFRWFSVAEQAYAEVAFPTPKTE